jgi:nucleoside-diphosphate-sugar epimerase
MQPVSRTDAQDRGRILVVGGAGYVGSVLSRQLIDAGYAVRILDSFLYGDSSLAGLTGHERVEVVHGDTRDDALVAEVLRDVDAVIHLGEIVGDPACALDPDLTIAVNVTASIRLAEQAKQAGVRRFVYPSSCSVYGASDEIVSERSALNPVSLYARGKIAVEQALLDLTDPTFETVIVRFATVYGLSHRPRFDLVVNLLAAKARSGGQIVVDGGGQWRPFVHVADAADALQLCLEAPADLVTGEVFNVGANDQNHTISEVAEIIRNRMPRTSIEYGEVRDPRNYRVKFDKISGQLGFAPRRLLVEGIDEIASALEDGSIVDFEATAFSNVETLRYAGVGAGARSAPLRPVMAVAEDADAVLDLPAGSISLATAS